MSLRAHVVILIGLILVVGVLVGSLSAGYHARLTLQQELGAAMTGGRQTVLNAFEDLPRSDHAERDLGQLVATFNGNRHVRAALTDDRGRTVRASTRAAPSTAAPSWFGSLLGRPPQDISIRAPAPIRDRRILLSPISDIDIGAVWVEFGGTVAALSVSALLGLAAVYLAIGAALRPLRALSGGFVRIGAGDYKVRVDGRGPRELRDLQRGFNDMADRLAAMSGRNRLLESQLLTLQDEERADLARDLHDEIGPHLFAVNVDAAVAGQLVGTERHADALGHVRSIQASVAHMQKLVREILGRLRPSRATELGLNAAILDLVAFWDARAPDIAIDCDVALDEATLDEACKDTVYRVVQEGLTNAVRHAAATRIAARVRPSIDGGVEVRVDDNGTAPSGPAAEGGLGLIGMRERVRAVGGTLTIDRSGPHGGWSVIASLPLDAAEPVR